ncbi:MAG: hypothetical protein WBD27_09195 [Pyrinomonadaceae bacterium]
MSFNCLIIPSPQFLLFRKGPDDEEIAEKYEITDVDEGLRGIRCPICRWKPDRTSLWTCWDCEHPAYFYNGCGTEWNTFDTSGLCPTCSHQWIWTSCLSCWGWSKHEDWYESERSK